MPKIILEDIPARIPVREPQLAEELGEVPTILYFVQQTIDIPVPRGGKRRLQGFLTGQSFQPTLEPVAEIPPGGGLQDFLPDQGSVASSSVLLDELFQGGFSHFTLEKKQRGSPGR